MVKRNSKHSYILADSSKVGITSMCKVFELDEITLITEKEEGLPKECSRYLIAE